MGFNLGFKGLKESLEGQNKFHCGWRATRRYLGSV